jgi:hypothetical protein
MPCREYSNESGSVLGFIPSERAPSYPLDRRLSGPHVDRGSVEYKKGSIFAIAENRIRNLGSFSLNHCTDDPSNLDFFKSSYIAKTNSCTLKALSRCCKNAMEVYYFRRP